MSLPTTDVPSNVMLLPSPSGNVEISDALDIAHDVFRRICPEEEYFPAIPDPEDAELEADLAAAETVEEELRRQRERTANAEEPALNAIGDVQQESNSADSSETLPPETASSLE